jgi:predicted ATP-grasp superfamily ATP-dependent carboligase
MAGRNLVPGGIVLGGDSQGLGIARSLGRRGIGVCVIDDEPSICRASRYVRRAIRVDDMRTEQGMLTALRQVQHDLRGWVLYPTRDENVAAIATHRDSIARHFRVPTPGLDVIRSVWDKRETGRLARDLGIPIPRTWYPRTSADLATIDCDGPLVVKPAIKEHFCYATKAKAWPARGGAELAEVFARAASIVPPGEVMVQEMLPGGASEQYAYCVMFAAGRALASMTVRRCRQHPSDFGRASTYVQTISLQALAEPATRLLRAIGYYGLAEVEFMRDQRDGRYRLLEVNARTWGYHSLGGIAGVDFPYLLYRDQVGASAGEHQRETRARPGLSWVRLLTDVPNAIRDLRSGTIGGVQGGRPSRAVLLRAGGYVHSLAAADTEAVFSLRDPLPGLYELALLPYLAMSRAL